MPMLHVTPIASACSFVRSLTAESLNKWHRLGDMNILRHWLLASFMLAGPTRAEAFQAGYWISSSRQIVLQISPCGGDLCGFIEGIALDHPSDAMPTDWQGRSQCGFLMLRVSPTPAKPSAPRWRGVLQDPRNGHIYRTTVRFDNAGNLVLHGYIGLPLFGRTQVWPKFHHQVLAGCHVPSLDGTT